MTQSLIKKPFDLEQRTFNFARQCREFIQSLPKTPLSLSDYNQLIRSSGSVGANYIEANESLGKKDFLMRIKICRKEAKESGYWLKLINIVNPVSNNMRQELVQEARELTMIFTKIIQKSI